MVIANMKVPYKVFPVMLSFGKDTLVDAIY